MDIYTFMVNSNQLYIKKVKQKQKQKQKQKKNMQNANSKL